jgi:hypothetical protein
VINYAAYDEEEDKELLESSYNAILQKNDMQIITDQSETDLILKKVLSILTIPVNSTFSFQNLFKLSSRYGQFYIAQCLLDQGFPVYRNLAQTYPRKYSFQLIGFAEIRFDLGKTVLRPETLGDKIIGRLFGNDIDLENAEIFNKKYYLVSTKKDSILRAFNQNFLNAMSRHDGLVLMTTGNQLLLTFETSLEEKQSAIVEDVLMNCDLLA